MGAGEVRKTLNKALGDNPTAGAGEVSASEVEGDSLKIEGDHGVMSNGARNDTRRHAQRWCSARRQGRGDRRQGPEGRPLQAEQRDASQRHARRRAPRAYSFHGGEYLAKIGYK